MNSPAFDAFAYATEEISKLSPEQIRRADESNMLNGKIPTVVNDESAKQLKEAIDNLIYELRKGVDVQ
jgi:hypothetical protein